MSTVRRIIVLEVAQDWDVETTLRPDWWTALHLPPPERWSEELGEHVYVTVLVEKRIA